MRLSPLALLSIAFLSVATALAEMPRLKVSPDGHFLMKEDGSPFFYLGDTAWELFHRLNREEAEDYLKNRSDKGFNVIQAVGLAELDGLNEPNVYGQKPLIDNDPTKPNEGYWKHVDDIVARAEKHGLYIGFLPTWGDKWNKKWGQGPEIFTPQNAEIYGEWLGKRYAQAAIIWILGGDRPVEIDAQREIVRAMARGLRRGDGGRHLQTFHPTGGAGSAQYFHEEGWLDFNMRQNGHVAEFNPRYAQTRVDYDRLPAKPILDAEPIYEGHPVSFKAKDFGHSIAADVRRPLYWDLFVGACGHTYGHHSVWQMYDPAKERKPVNNPLMSWRQALDEPGAAQMQYGRRLMESRPFLSRVPDDSIIVTDAVETFIPGAGTRRFVATRDRDGKYAMIYAPVGRAFRVKMSAIAGKTVKAWWFNPRDGSAMAAGEFSNEGEKEFVPPNPGEFIDWVLVLDDAAQHFPPPGQPLR